MRSRKRSGRLVLIIAVFCAVLIAFGSVVTSSQLRSSPSNEEIVGTLDAEIDTPKPASVGDWTLMVYLDADCNLEGAGIQDIN